MKIKKAQEKQAAATDSEDEDGDVRMVDVPEHLSSGKSALYIFKRAIALATILCLFKPLPMPVRRPEEKAGYADYRGNVTKSARTGKTGERVCQMCPPPRRDQEEGGKVVFVSRTAPATEWETMIDYLSSAKQIDG